MDVNAKLQGEDAYSGDDAPTEPLIPPEWTVVWQFGGTAWMNAGALVKHLLDMMEHAEMTRNAQMGGTVQDTLDWLESYGVT